MTEAVIVLAAVDGADETLLARFAALADDASARWSWAVKVVTFSVEEQAKGTDSATGLELDTGPLKYDTRTEHVAAWELISVLEQADLVHVVRPFTRAGELAVLTAKLLGKRLCVSGLSEQTSDLGLSFGILELANAVICESEAELERYSTGASAHLLRESGESFLDSLKAIYLTTRGQ